MAWVPSATTIDSPVMRCFDSTQSPAAQTPSVRVRMHSSTTMPPASPTAIPALAASAELARTPDQFNTLNDFTMICFYTGKVDMEIDAVRIGSAVA